MSGGVGRGNYLPVGTNRIRSIMWDFCCIRRQSIVFSGASLKIRQVAGLARVNYLWIYSVVFDRLLFRPVAHNGRTEYFMSSYTISGRTVYIVRRVQDVPGQNIEKRGQFSIYIYICDHLKYLDKDKIR